jgi:dihydrofolate synthase/folylpolyglutamate synthase
MAQMTYRQAIEYLYSLTDYETRRIERYTPETFGLSRVQDLVKILGNPHTKYRSVHIAGTKGKGSTAAMIESVLRAAGYRTGLYTSPHLHTFRERIRVDGELIPRNEVTDLVTELQPRFAEVEGTTTFEAITVIAMEYFARRKIDVLVAEVGLGGRLDATNVLEPEVSIITSLSYDHTYILGQSLEEIAREKGGIIKPGVPVVSASQQSEAAAVIEEICRSRGAQLIKVGRDWVWEAGAIDLGGQSFKATRVAGDNQELSGTYHIPLLGRHQLGNATCVLAAAQVLRESGFTLPRSIVKQGLAETNWPGRMEILSLEPLVVIDGAHNPYSAEILRVALEEWFPNRRWTLVFGAFVDKDISGMLKELLPITEQLIVTRSQHPRAAAPVELADMAVSAGMGAEVAISMSRAMQRALAVTQPGSGILVTGSVSLVGEAREEWARRDGRPIPDNDR